MGNCQAIDAATVVLQYPNGKEEKLYGPVNAREIMKMNPGHHVALLVSSAVIAPEKSLKNGGSSVRVTHIKLLRPSEALRLGHVYRLITTQEVMKGLREKKQAKMKKNQFVSAGKSEQNESEENKEESEERKRGGNRGRRSAASKSRTWHPSLQSISEATS